MQNRSLLIPIGVVLAAPLAAQTVVDGTIAGDAYGAAKAVQQVQTGFGDNLSELNAAYTTVEGGRLFVAFTGNLEANFNKLEVFFDTRLGGENIFSGVPCHDLGLVANMIGFQFDAGFDADYHIILRRGFDMGLNLNKFDVNISELGTPNFSEFIDVFGGTLEGSGTTGTGPANASPIEAAYDDSNTAGILSGNIQADQSAALAVTTGIEFSVDLADLGSPVGDIKIMVFVNGTNHDFASNQFLGSLIPPQGNPGGDGFGGFTGTVVFDLNTFAGDQFFCVPSAPPTGVNYCVSLPNSSSNAAVISAGGSNSIADATLALVADGLPANVVGIFYFGTQQVTQPFGDGFRCVGGSVQRLPIDMANAAGQLSEPNVFTQPAPNLPLGVGTFNFQAWFRDPLAMGNGFNLSDGIAVTFMP